MCNLEGHWISGTKTNLFLVQNNGDLLTPDLTQSGVSGVMRGLVLERAREQGLQVKEGIVTTADLKQAQGIFLTNSLIGIWPVRKLAGTSYKLDAIPTALRAVCLQSIKDPSPYTWLSLP
jgi:4-amino-4-deoxychorismate lyase